MSTSEWLQMRNTWTICEETLLGKGRNGKVINLMGPTMGVLKHVGSQCEREAESAWEANVMTKLHHPNICSMYAAVKHMGKAYLLLERLGKPLGSAFQRRSVLPSYCAAVVLYQTAQHYLGVLLCVVPVWRHQWVHNISILWPHLYQQPALPAG